MSIENHNLEFEDFDEVMNIEFETHDLTDIEFINAKGEVHSEFRTTFKLTREQKQFFLSKARRLGCWVKFTFKQSENWK